MSSLGGPTLKKKKKKKYFVHFDFSPLDVIIFCKCLAGLKVNVTMGRREMNLLFPLNSPQWPVHVQPKYWATVSGWVQCQNWFSRQSFERACIIACLVKFVH